MVTIGYRPILWHVMKYYAHFGYRDFILALGYKADVIKEYFLRYNEALSNDFVLNGGGHDVEFLGRDLDDWRIASSTPGSTRTSASGCGGAPPPSGREIFLANYGDTLTDAPLDSLVDDFRRSDASPRSSASLPRASPTSSATDSTGWSRASRTRTADVWINGGYFMFRPEIFDHIRPGDELVEAPFRRLIEQGKLASVRYDGYWPHGHAQGRPEPRRRVGRQGAAVGRLGEAPSRPRERSRGAGPAARPASACSRWGAP